jgi:hypothetical protein
MFKLFTSDTYGSESMIGIAGAAGAEYKIGQPLKLEDGAATLAAGNDKVQYICEQDITIPTEGGRVIVHRVLPQYIYETVLTADGASLCEGDMVTVASDGSGITATTGGCAEIVKIIDTAAGGKVRVRLA